MGTIFLQLSTNLILIYSIFNSTHNNSIIQRVKYLSLHNDLDYYQLGSGSGEKKEERNTRLESLILKYFVMF